MAEDLFCHRAVRAARFSLVCFPHAGGNASAFRDWPAHLPPDVAVYAARYPGRLDRLGEPPPATIPRLAEAVAASVTRLPGRIVLFGHSMGAVVAHEVAVLLERGGRQPAALAVSGREAPHLVTGPPSPTDDASLLANCQALGGIPDGVLDDEEMRELVLGPLRTDAVLLNAHRGTRPSPVRAPILAYLGVDDPGCTVAQIDGWRTLTTGGFRLRLLAGGHFSVLREPAELLADLDSQV